MSFYDKLSKVKWQQSYCSSIGGNTFAHIFGIYVCAHISFAHKKVLSLRTFRN